MVAASMQEMDSILRGSGQVDVSVRRHEKEGLSHLLNNFHSGCKTCYHP